MTMAYLLIANLAYNNQTSRNNALSAINAALASYSTTAVTTAQPAGVNTSGTTNLTISVRINNASDADSVRAAVLTAWTGQTRATTGQFITLVKED